MSTSPQLVGAYRCEAKTIDDTYATRIGLVYAASTNGARIHQASLCSSDNAANSAGLYYLKKMTAQTAAGVAAFVDGGGGNDTFTRTVGSFTTDGWRTNDIAYFNGALTRANDFKAEVIGVNATTLTFATGTVNTAENLPATGFIYKAVQLASLSVPAGAGVTAGVPAIDLLDDALNPMFDASPDRYIVVGPFDAIGVAPGTGLGAGEQFDVFIGAGDY